MKNWITFLAISVLFMVMFSGCGPSEEEQRRAEQARQDSLEQVRQQQLEQQRQDSIAQARADSIAAAKEKEQAEQDQIDVTFDPDGAYSVQVEAWRSQGKAEEQVQKWVDRGFDDAFVVQYGLEETGNVWFRVRLGRLSSREAAENLRTQLNDRYDAPSWISSGGS